MDQDGSGVSQGYPVAIVTISSIAVRRITLPPQFHDLRFTATVVVGENTLVTRAAQSIFDQVSGLSLVFSDQMECRVNSSYDARTGVSVSVASEGGEVSLGRACCHGSKEWCFMSKPRAEVQATFFHDFIIMPPHAQQQDQLQLQRGPGTGGQQQYRHARRWIGSAGTGDGRGRPSTAATAATRPTSDMRPLLQQQKRPPTSVDSAMASALPATVARCGTRRPTTAGSARGATSQSSFAIDVGCGAAAVDQCAGGPLLPVRKLLVTDVCAKKLAFSPNEEEPLFLTAHFCHQEAQTSTALAKMTHTGHEAQWLAPLVFDIPLNVVDWTLTFRLWTGNTRDSGRVIGRVGMVVTEGDVTCHASGAATTRVQHSPPRSVVLFFPQLTHSRLAFSLQIEHHRPLMEGASGRPKSAHVRAITCGNGEQRESAWVAGSGRPRAPPVNCSVVSEEEEIRDDDGGESVGSEDEVRAFRVNQAAARQVRLSHARQETSSLPAAASAAVVASGGRSSAVADLEPPARRPGDSALSGESALRGLNAAPHPLTVSDVEAGMKAMNVGDDEMDEGAVRARVSEAELEHMLTEITASVRDALARALEPVMLRLDLLESRMRRTEHLVGAVLMPGTKHTTMSDAELASGATGAQSMLPGPVHEAANASSAVISPEEISYSFEGYDHFSRGFITTSQLTHFYRTHNSFADDESPCEIERILSRFVSDWEMDRVTLPEFAAVALSLAKM